MLSGFVSGVYHTVLHHDEWYVESTAGWLKIDLFYEDSGNREEGTGAIVFEVDIEAADMPA